MNKRQTVIGKDCAPTADDIAHCDAISNALRVFARHLMDAQKASVGNMLDGLLSAYVNETLKARGPLALRESAEQLREFADGLVRRAAN